VDIGILTSCIGAEEGYAIISEVDALPLKDNYDARTQIWYQGAKARDGIFWTDIFVDALGKGIGISCAMPFYDLSNGEKVFKGVAENGIVLHGHVEEIINSTKTGTTGYAFLLNNRGHVIMSLWGDRCYG
jgi:hypothetical protein